MRYPFEDNAKEIDVLSSRFIAMLMPLEEEKDVPSLLDKVSSAYPKATHYVYAYRVLPYEGYSDDGEPKWTAGLPVLEALRKTEVDKALLVVVRYFGGRKLGASRLTRTYREAAIETLSSFMEASYIDCLEVRMETDYKTASSFEKEALRRGFSVFDKDYGDSVALSVAGNAKMMGPFLEEWKDKTRISVTERVTKRMKKDD